ncbi:Uncharacterised protein [uncultured archaeon]|nr:Uncharacterised protein [uncultured archaeon]
MYNGFKLQEVHPIPAGANPLWLEQREKGAKIRRYGALFLLLLIAIGAYYVAVDYLGAADPNASECKMGFVDTGCKGGFECVGGLVPCYNNSGAYKYSLTKLIFPEKRCTSSVVYKEMCMPKNAS